MKINAFTVGDDRWLIKKDGVSPNSWSLTKFGDTGTLPMAFCSDGFNENGVLACSGFVEFRFDKTTGRFLYAYLTGYTHANRLNNEGADTPAMTIGKCSAI
jgi:hypothetical protein